MNDLSSLLRLRCETQGDPMLFLSVSQMFVTEPEIVDLCLRKVSYPISLVQVPAFVFSNRTQ